MLKRPRYTTLCAIVVFVALAFALFWSALVGGKVLSNGDVIFGLGPWSSEKPAALQRPANPAIDDQTYEFAPDLLVTRTALANGQAPLWNPYQGAGRPLLASIQHAPLFPPQALTLLLPFWHAQVWAAVLKLLIAAIGMFFLARGCGLARGPSTVAATCYAFSAYMIDWLVSPIGNSMSMAPWVIALAGRVAVGARWRDAAWLGVAIAFLLLGGHPETILFTLGGAAAWAACEYTRVRRARTAEATGAGSSVARRGLLLGAGALLGLGLAAVTIIPFAELLLLSSGTSRAGGPYGINIAYSFAFPEMWGNPSKLIGDLGPVNYVARTAYLGALPLLLAASGIFARRPRGRQVEWIALTGVALLVVLPNPVHSLVADLPVLDKTNLISTMFLAVLGLSVLAGFGLQAWLESDRAGRRRMLIVAGVVALVPVVALLREIGPFAHLGTALGQLPSLHSTFSDSAALRSVAAWRWLVFCAAGVAALLALRLLTRRGTVLVVVALIGVDLVSLNHGFQPAIPLSYANPPVPRAISYLQAHQGDQRITGSYTAESQALLPALAERYGLRDLQQYDLPKTDRFTALWAALGQAPGDLSWWDQTRPDALATLNLFAVRYVLLPPGVPAPGWLKPVFRQGNEVVAENPTALPRAWVAYSWRSAPDRSVALRQTIASSTTQLLHAPVIEHAGAQTSGPPVVAAPARLTVDQNERVVVRVRASRSAYLILDDTYYPGWTAMVDGRSEPVLAANGYFRAVRIPAGSHVVTFSYAPASATAGLWISVASIVVLCLTPAGIWLYRRRRPGQATVAAEASH